MKMKDLLSAETAFKQVVSIDDGKLALKLLDICGAVQKKYEDYNDLRNKKIKEYEPETLRLDATHEHYKDFATYMNELAETEIDVTWNPISVVEISKHNISAATMMILINIGVLVNEQPTPEKKKKKRGN